MSLLLTDVTSATGRPRGARRRRPDRLAGPGRRRAGRRPIDRGGGGAAHPGLRRRPVHATATGMALTGLDLHSSSSLAETVAARGPVRAALARHRARHRLGRDRLAGAARADPADLDAALGYRPAYLARVDVHSATVSTALLEEHARHRRPAGLLLRRPAAASTPTTPPGGPPTAPSARPRRAAQRATLDAAAALGIGSLHEMGGPEVSGVDDLTDLLTLAAEQPGPEVVGYWGELAERGGLDTVRELGLAGAGGDLFCDGALGSHTAALAAGPTPTGRTPPARCASRPDSRPPRPRLHRSRHPGRLPRDRQRRGRPGDLRRRGRGRRARAPGRPSRAGTGWSTWR